MIKQVEIKLNYPFLYKWKTKKDTSVLTNGNVENYFGLFDSKISADNCINFLNQLEGNFALVINRDTYLLAAADRIRSFPLFYNIEGEKILITDDIASCETEFVYNGKVINTFKKIFCTEGNHTLLRNWKQIPAGEFVFVNKVTGELVEKKYFVFRSKWPQQKINSAELKEIFLNAFRSILDRVGTKTIIVPLSGGYDSRCIIAILKELNAKNIFTYTYGTVDSFEKKIAQKVTTELNIDWHFIEYTPELLDSFFREEWKNFSFQNHGFTSLPNEQDFFALLHLQQNKLLPENGVIISGYLGDYLAGCKINFDNAGANEDDQIEYLYLNRGSKYILNSIRLYEYFGLEWFVPFGDNRILDYIFHVPLRERQIENGYNNFLSEAFFKPLNIDFKKPGHEFENHHTKNFLKKYLPKKIVAFIQYHNSFNKTNDPNNSAYLRKKLSNIPGNDNKQNKKSFNEMYAEYFIRCLKEETTTNKIYNKQTNNRNS